MPRLLACWVACVLALAAVPAKCTIPSLKDDTTCSVPEEQWYDAQSHFNDLNRWATALQGWVDPKYHLLEVFGASKGLQKTWQRAGKSGVSFDIKISKTHDLCTECGVKVLIQMGLQLVQRGLVVSAPPCSLYGPCCSSIHRRSTANPYGDMSNYKVRLARLIWSNFVVCLRLLHLLQPSLWHIVEQPKQSWAFKIPEFQSVAELMGLFCVLTYMGCYNHDLEKGTHLKTNMATVEDMRRRMTKAERNRIKKRFQRKQAKRRAPRDYHHRTRTGWQGGRDLPKSAYYTPQFCAAIMACWMKAREALLIGE